MSSTSYCTILPYSDAVGKLRHHITWRPFKCVFRKPQTYENIFGTKKREQNTHTAFENHLTSLQVKPYIW